MVNLYTIIVVLSKFILYITQCFLSFTVFEDRVITPDTDMVSRLSNKHIATARKSFSTTWKSRKRISIHIHTYHISKPLRT